MKELDFMLMTFLKEGYSSLNEQQKQAFTELLTYSDPALLAYFLEQEQALIPDHDEIVLLVIHYARKCLPT